MQNPTWGVLRPDNAREACLRQMQAELKAADDADMAELQKGGL